MPPRLTLANRDFKSLTPVAVVSCSPTSGCCGVVEGGGRNLLATAYPALKSFHPRLLGSLFHFCPNVAAVCTSCLFGGPVSSVRGKTLFATLSPALASAKVRLFGSLLYLEASEVACLTSPMLTLDDAAGFDALDAVDEAEEVFRSELRRSLTVEESTAVPNVFWNFP
jgi:hypothetical protein